MTLERLLAHCTAKPGVEETFPFGPDVLVLKAGGKMFALVGLNDYPYFVNLKCDPERAGELRAEYESVRPGYHMNKTNWNSVDLEGDVPGDLLFELVDHSYELIVAGLPKAKRALLGDPAE